MKNIKRIFSRHEQIAYLAECLGDQVAVLKAKNQISKNEEAVLEAVINYAQTVVLYFKTSSADTIEHAFNLLIEANNYLKTDNLNQKMVLLNILKHKYKSFSNGYNENAELHNISM